LENVKTKQTYEEETDAVFVFVGSIPQTALVPEVEKDEGGSIITDQRMESSIKGLFVAGDVRATPSVKWWSPRARGYCDPQRGPVY